MKIAYSDFITSSWSGGETSQVIILPKDAKLSDRNFDFRVSTATCNLEESKFSDFSGYKRFIAPVYNEIELEVNGKKHKLKPYEILEFSGSDTTISRGKLRDYNLIVREGKKASLESLEIEGELKLALTGKTYLIQNFEDSLTYKINEEEGQIKDLEAIFLEKTQGNLILEKKSKHKIFLVTIDD